MHDIVIANESYFGPYDHSILPNPIQPGDIQKTIFIKPDNGPRLFDDFLFGCRIKEKKKEWYFGRRQDWDKSKNKDELIHNPEQIDIDKPIWIKRESICLVPAK